MVPMLVSVTSHEWNAVKAYVSLRRTELIEEATSVAATDEERRNAVMRLDELAILLKAPEATRQAAEAEFEASQNVMNVY